MAIELMLIDKFVTITETYKSHQQRAEQKFGIFRVIKLCSKCCTGPIHFKQGYSTLFYYFLEYAL